MRMSFGGDLAGWHVGYGELATDPNSGLSGRQVLALGNIEVTFWNSQTGGTRYTDLTDAAGTPITSVTTSTGNATYPLGVMPQFFGPDDIAVMYAQPAGSPRVRITAVDAYNAFAGDIGDVSGLSSTLTTLGGRVSALETSDTTQNSTISNVRNTVTSLETQRNITVAELRTSAAQNITNVYTTVLFQTEGVDTDWQGVGGHSTTSNTGRWTCSLAGYYLIAGSVPFTGNNTGSRYVRWSINGVIRPGFATYSGPNMASATSAVTLQANTLLVSLAPGDYLELQAMQSSNTANLPTSGPGEFQPHMTVVMMRPL